MENTAEKSTKNLGEILEGKDLKRFYVMCIGYALAFVAVLSVDIFLMVTR